jgi:hypothetical protein
VPFSRVSQRTTTSKASLSLLGRHFTLRSEGLFMAWLFSPKKKLSRRFLKRSDPLLFAGDTSWRQHGRLLIRDVFGTDPPIFLNGCPSSQHRPGIGCLVKPFSTI